MTSPLVPYVLITPARNEAPFIETTIQSMIKQTLLPSKWVIVNDGSTDNTAAIVRPYLPDHPWMELVDLPVRKERHFAAKVYAFDAGQERIKGLEYEIIGNLDADVSLDADHFEFLMTKFRDDPTLGVAGTIFKEPGYSSETDSFEGQNHVSGQCQIFRRQCFEQIGGYCPNKAGGIDWMAVTTARMMGWKTRSYREKSFFHHRTLGTAERGRYASLFGLPKCIPTRPYLLDGIAVGAGYLWAFVRREKRPVSADLMRFHRKEQMQKLRGILRALVTFRRVDNFEAKAI
jgi:biofilm PGA synthesis N-glycosyltransferase PgaC